EDALVGAGPRVRHRALDRAVYGRRAPGRGGVTLSRAVQARGERAHRGRLGDHREQSSREVLPSHGGRKEAAAHVARLLVAVRPRRHARARDRAGFRLRLSMARDPQDAPPPSAERARTWRRYLRFFGPRSVDDLDDELRFHIEMRVHDYMTRGMSEADARAATAQRLGDIANARTACATIATRRDRRMTRALLFDALLQDL